jgi:hypothetical protein
VEAKLEEHQKGKTLHYTLKELLEMQKYVAKELAAQAAGSNDAQAQAKLEEQNQVRTTLQKISRLKISISRCVLGFVSL